MPITLTTNTSNVTVDATTNTITVSSTPANVVVSTQASGISNAVIRSAFSVNDTGGDGSLTYAEATGEFTYAGPSAAEVRSHFSATSPISLSSGVISIDSSALFSGKTTDDLAEGSTNLYFTDARANAVLAANTTDELSEGTQNLYWSKIGDPVITTYLPEGTNLYFTDARADARVNALLPNTDSLSEGSTNLYFTDARADARVNLQTGINLDLQHKTTDELHEGTNNLFYTTDRSNTAITAHFANASAAPFVFNGNVDVQGNLNYVNTEDLLVKDSSITLNVGNVAQDAHIFVDRTGASGNNVAIRWNETTDKWQFTNNGTTYQDIGSFGGATSDDLPQGTNNIYFSTTGAAVNTTNLTEGTNLYYTTARQNTDFDTRLATKTTSDIAEGTNLYYTDGRFDTRFDSRLASKSTSNLTEGTNLYYTTDRANTAIGAYTGDMLNINNITPDIITLKDVKETRHDHGNVSNQVSVDISDGTIQSMRLVSNITGFTFSDLDDGGSVTLILQQDGVGFRTLDFTTTPSNWTNWKWVSDYKTLNTANDSYDLISITYDGTYYFASLVAFEDSSVIQNSDLANSSITINNKVYNLGDDATLEGLTGNIATTGNLSITGHIATTGNVDASYFIGDGSQLTNLPGGGGGSGTVTSVTAGDGMTQSGTSTINPTLDVVGGFGITVNADNIELSNADLASLTDPITTTGTITAGLFEGNINGAVLLKVFNNTGTRIDKGNVVYLPGGNHGAEAYVENARADSATTMPAFGIAYEDITAGNPGEIVTLGELTGLDLTGFTTGDHLFVSPTTAGAFQNTQPTGEANLIQNIGKVVKGGNGGALEFTGAGRANDTDNLDEGNIFLGSTSNTAINVTPSNNFNTLSNAFDLSNDLTNINSITSATNSDLKLYAGNVSPGSTQFHSKFGAGLVDTNVGSIVGDGYGINNTFNFRDTINTDAQAITTTLLNDSSQNIDAYAFAGTTTAGSNQFAITDGGTFRSFNLNGSFTSDFTTAKAGIGQYCGWQDIYLANWLLPQFTNQVPGFPPDVYVVSVDTVGNTITMSKNAQTSETFTASSPAIIPQGAVDTASGFLLDITSENDFGISTDRTVIPMGTGAQFGVIGVGVRKLSDTYNYPLTGPTQDDFQWSLGSSSDWTYNLGSVQANREPFLKQRSSLEVEQGHYKAPRGMLIGNSTEMSNRGFADPITSFGLNIMWDGSTDSTNLQDFDSAGSALPQILLKSYNTGTFGGIGASQRSRGGPRLFFAAANGSVNDSEVSVYPIQDQELGRLSFWGSAGDNATPSSVNVPALINVNAHDDWTSQGGSGVGGNSDMHLAATSNKDNGADVFMSYEAGELVLASGKTTASANIVLAPAQQSNNGNVSSAYSGAVHQYARANYNNMGTETGSKLSVVQGTNSNTIGDIALSITRDYIEGTDSVSLAQYASWINGNDVAEGDTVIILSNPGTFNSIETDGTQITISGVSGPGSSNLNGGTFYVKTIASEDVGTGLGGSGSAVFLYTDAATTTRATNTAIGVQTDFGPPSGGTGTQSGTVSWTVTGTAAKEWEFELESGSTDLKIKEDGVTRVTVDSAGDITANSFIGDGSQLTGLPGGGSVTSVGSGNGLTGGPITGSGSLEIDTGVVVDLTTAQTLTGAKTLDDATLKKFKETVVALGNQSGDISSQLDANNGSIYTVTATGGITIDSIANAQTGTSMTIKVVQDGTGSHALSSTMKFAGAEKTLSAAPNAIDVISVFYDGSDYLASLTKGYA